MKYIRECLECYVSFRTEHKNGQLCSTECARVRKRRQDREWRVERRAKNHKILIELVGGTWSCQDCGLTYPEMRWLDWHHLDPSIKERPISGLIERSTEVVLAEALKCKLLCPNCHRKAHIKMTDERRK